MRAWIVAVMIVACGSPARVEAPVEPAREAPVKPLAAVDEPQPVEERFAWHEDEATAVLAARSARRPIIVNFHAEWCTACKELETKTFTDPEVQRELRRFVAIRIDATDDEAPETARLERKYRVIGLPTVILLDADGHEVARVNEYVERGRFLAELAKVR